MEEVLITTPQTAYHFSVRLEAYLEKLPWENRAVLRQIRLMRTYLCTWHPLRHSRTPNLAGQPLAQHSLITAAALLRKMHVNIFVIYFPAETQQLQQFSREFSDMSHFLSVLGAIDCTLTFLLGYQV